MKLRRLALFQQNEATWEAKEHFLIHTKRLSRRASDSPANCHLPNSELGGRI